MNQADPLAALRDIHVPDPPGFWPPAPGWIAAACVVIAAGVAATVIVARWWRAGRVRREALASLRSLRARHQAGAPATEIATELSTLVRRFALARRPREEVAGLTGERWIAWLESALLDTGPGLTSEPWFKLEFGPQVRAQVQDRDFSTRRAARCPVRTRVPLRRGTRPRRVRALDSARVSRRALSFAAAAAAALVLGDARAQSLEARLDRNPIHDDETVHLIVEADTQTGGARPDITPLRRDFEILGQSTSTHIAIENGARSVRTEWIIELAPKRSGRITIGPLRVGTMTSPAIGLEVLSASSTAARSERDVFLEVEVTPQAVYVPVSACLRTAYLSSGGVPRSEALGLQPRWRHHPSARQGCDVRQGRRRPALPGHRTPVRDVPAGERAAHAARVSS